MINSKIERDGELFYIFRINLIGVRNFIIDNQLSEIHTIRLNHKNFDSLVLEYREYYGKSMELPFFMFDTLIEEDTISQVPADRLMVVIDENRLKRTELENQPIYLTIHRCGFCGNIVDYDGSEFDDEVRYEKIKILENKKNVVTQLKVRGKCCRNE